MIALLALLPALAASPDPIDPRCQGLSRPADYDEQTQQDFLQNYYALALTLSPLHGPMPHAPGRGAVGVDLLGIPPLPCARRFVLGWTKTEDTNKTPVAPRPRVTVALPALGEVVPYAGFAYLPPITVFGTRNVVVSGELGAGLPVGERLQVGGRFHATMLKTVADIATAFNPDDPPVDDLFLGSTFGFDLLAGYAVGEVVPYLAVGFTDVSTFFYVGDDGAVSNNLHPYAGPVFSLGADALFRERLRLGAEVYAAPGGHARVDPEALTLTPPSRYGRIYTGRLRLAWEL